MSEREPGGRIRAGLVVEIALFLVIAYSVIFTMRFLLVEGRLPQPYFYGSSDTLMDWISVAYWSNNPGAYYAYLSVYPPIAFDFLRIFSIHACYRFDGSFARDCDWLARVMLCAFYVFANVSVYLVYRKRDRRTALWRTGAIAIGLPMLYAMERGNLVIVCFAFFVLGHGRLLRSAWLRWLSLAISIHFKPYLVATLLPQLVRRRWRWFEGAALAGLLVYVISYAMEGAGSPMELISNIVGFSDQPVLLKFDGAYYTTTYQLIMDILKSTFPLMMSTGSQPLEIMAILFPAMLRIGQIGVIGCFVGAAWRPHSVPLYRLTAMSTALLITSTNAGGYSQIFLCFLVFLEPWRGPARVTALVTVYVLSISADYALTPLATATEYSWLTNRLVTYNLFVQAGELVRPGLLLLIEYALVAASVVDIVRARREEVSADGRSRSGVEHMRDAGATL